MMAEDTDAQADPKALHTLAGIEAFIQGDLHQSLQHGIVSTHRVPTMALVIGPGAFPQYQAQGGIQVPKKVVERKARALVLSMHASGVLFVEQDGPSVIVRLEHRTFGDQTFRATIQFPTLKLTPFSDALPTFDDEKTRLFPGRYMC